jgi:nitroreductase
MNPDFLTLQHIIQSRRTTKPPQMNGRLIPDDQIREILALADWAPTHANTEPWRFVVFAGKKVGDFCRAHAALYKSHTTPDKFLEVKLEEIAATSCAIQNLLLGATALGIASYWGSGGMAYHPAMKEMLQLREEDVVLGILYLGYTDKTDAKGKRVVSLDEKIRWM